MLDFNTNRIALIAGTTAGLHYGPQIIAYVPESVPPVALTAALILYLMWSGRPGSGPAKAAIDGLFVGLIADRLSARITQYF